ncbi:MAG: hypothetical protein R6U20_09945 [Longimonas sp.]|uniref:hypothetical protein n=1 Tax=Longimonas sp. TaxID=2039626 RepID=UPI00397541E0
MVYPENFEEKIGFDQIRKILHEHCISPMGQDWIEQISFSSDFTTIGKNLEQVYQFMQLIRFAPSFPTHDYKDMRHRLRLLSTEGAIIAQDDLHDLNCSLKVMESVKAYLKDLDPEQYDELIALAKGKTSWQEFTEQADGIIDNKGEIRPDASAALEDITRKIKTLEKGLYSKIQQTLTQAKKSGWVGNEAEITVRNGRLVIPVFASQKRKLKGFIHDESSSGQTVYMEPEAAFEANNEIRKLGNAYRKEIKRILGEYSGKLRPWIFELIDDYQWLGKVDAIHSKALLAIKLHAEKPKLINEQGFSWQSAIHPLLYLVFKAQNKEVIPLNISLNKDQRILIISGPNAGGKSVCLKTTGLLQYMLQCGLLVPMHPEHLVAGDWERYFGADVSISTDMWRTRPVLVLLEMRRISMEMTDVRIPYEYNTHRHFSLCTWALAAAPLRAVGRAVVLPQRHLAVYAAHLPLPPNVFVVRRAGAA